MGSVLMLLIFYIVFNIPFFKYSAKLSAQVIFHQPYTSENESLLRSFMRVEEGLFNNFIISVQFEFNNIL